MKDHCEINVPMIHNDTPKDQSIGDLQSAIAERERAEGEGTTELEKALYVQGGFLHSQNVSLGFR